MKLSYIKEFITLAETRKYRVAAKKLSISQASLSKHIKHVEWELGIPLFNRTTRKMELSEFGALMLPHARQIIDIEQEYMAIFARQGGQGIKQSTVVRMRKDRTGLEIFDRQQSSEVIDFPDPAT